MKLNLIEANAHYDMVHGKPAVLEHDNDGSGIYRIWSKPTKSNLKKAIIRSVIDETAEFDLVNSYNKHVLGIAPNDKAVADYKEYLQFTEDLDVMLKTDLSN